MKTQITSEGSVVGTLPYMSPERLAGPGAGGPESDVYSLAAFETWEEQVAYGPGLMDGFWSARPYHGFLNITSA